MDHLKDHLGILPETHQEDQIVILPIERLDLERRMRKKPHNPMKKRKSRSYSPLW
jgi:hypothetical protein